MADLGLSDKETKRVMAEADFNGDGEIGYEEFIPLAVDLVQTMYAKLEAEQARAADEAAAREEAQNYLLHGMTKEEVPPARRRDASNRHATRRVKPPRHAQRAAAAALRAAAARRPPLTRFGSAACARRWRA